MEALQIFLKICQSSLMLIVVCLVASHIICWFISKKPVLLNKDSLVVILGACMGIGRQMVLQVAKKHKCNILIVDIRKDLFAQVQKQVQAQGATSIYYQANLADPKQVQKLIHYLKEQHKIDLLIYNAGIVIRKRSYDTSEEEHMSVMRVNYFTPIAIIQGLSTQLEGSHIAVAASIVAIVSGGINFSSYTSSKHALFGYLASLRQQYKKDKKNITLSVACPYLINTTMFAGLRNKLDFIFPCLDEKYVARRLVKQFIRKKQVCFIYQYQAILFRIIEFLPTQLIDWAQINLITTPEAGLAKPKEQKRMELKKD